MEALALGGMVSFIFGVIVFFMFIDLTINIRRIRKAAEKMAERDRQRMFEQYPERAKNIEAKKKWTEGWF